MVLILCNFIQHKVVNIEFILFTFEAHIYKYST